MGMMNDVYVGQMDREKGARVLSNGMNRNRIG